MPKIRTALVVGGGIAGPVVAMALQQAGIDATIYEAHPTSSDRQGSFLTLATNGIRALRAVGADQRVVAGGFSTPKILLRSTTGKNLGEVPLGIALPDGTSSHTLKRADLYQAIREEAVHRDITFEHGKRLINIEHASAGVRAIFEDGSDAAGDVLIGADGVHSVVRRMIDVAAPAPTYSGLIGLGGYARDMQVEADPGDYIMMFGKKAFFGYVLAPSREVWWFANVPVRDEPRGDMLHRLAPQGWQRRLVELFADDAGPAASLVRETYPADIMRPTVIHSIPHLPRWHDDRVTVIGDAAHAPTPTSGQGASLAIEDALVLAKCLRDRRDPQLAFQSFESLRRRRVERIIKAAARTNSNKAAGGAARVLRDAMLPMMLKMMTNSKRAMEPYDYDIDWDASVSQEVQPLTTR
ncbi:MAG: FAD-dependent monooxygenase [Actinomycetota bacterium]|nr:FAD-dependent monooxygenase [Actinomycetota bacterium]